VGTSKHNCLRILFITLTTCFGHCGPSSGEHNGDDVPEESYCLPHVQKTNSCLSPWLSKYFLVTAPLGACEPK